MSSYRLHLAALSVTSVVTVGVVLSACGNEFNDEILATGGDAGGDNESPPIGFGDSGTGEGGANDANADGGCSQVCPSGQVCANGACVPSCGAYQSFCNGACTPTVVDPKNCGGCGVACTGALACSGGKCESSCLPGLEACNNTCVDKKSDNDNCGACGTKCGAGKGCVDGTCQTAVAVGPAPGKCTGGGGGPVINPQGQGGCLGKLASTVFRWALCSCKDVQFSDKYLTDGYDSTLGPYKPGGIGAGVGANENYGTSKRADVWGSLWIAGSGGIGTGDIHVVKSEVRAGGQLKSSGGAFSISKDAYAEQAVQASSALTIGGKLYVPQGTSVTGTVPVGGVVNGPVDVAPPCDFCEASQKVPIANIVAAHVTPNNDNASIGLGATVYESPNGPLRLDLPCGEYYLTKISSSSHVTIAAHGKTALYINGDVSPNGITFAVDPGGEFDVFISGSIGSSGVVRIGSPNYPAATRVYIGGTAGLSVSSTTHIAGNIYAANGPVTYSSDAEQYGSIYAGNFSASKPVAIHYDTAVVTSAGKTCDAPGGGGTDGGGGGNDGGGGGGPSSCGTCKDCGNQACVNATCGACSNSGQCCAPLVCVNGSCVPDLVVK